MIATIRGCKEPDRFVLLGNHRDAWSFGAADPHSGTAVMLEISEAFAKTMKSEKWCPRRSLVFGSWAAEELGLIGSQEWAEEHQSLLKGQAVAYLNVDTAMRGNFTLQVNAVPLLYSTVVSALKAVDNPNPDEVKSGRKTVFDTTLVQRPSKLIKGYPEIRTPGSGSDHTSFLEIAGVPVLDMSYDSNLGHVKFPLYHTMYETYYLIANLTDPGFRYCRALAQVWAEVARSLADTPVLPFVDSLQYYPLYLKSALNELKNSQYKDILLSSNISLGKGI